MAVTLTTAAFLAVLGVGFWLIGTLLGYQGIGTIGAVVVVGLGIVVMGGGLEYQTGEEIVETEHGETVEYQYSTFDSPSQLPLGFLIALAGGVMTLRALDPSSSRRP